MIFAFKGARHRAISEKDLNAYSYMSILDQMTSMMIFDLIEAARFFNSKLRNTQPLLPSTSKKSDPDLKIALKKKKSSRTNSVIRKAQV